MASTVAAAEPTIDTTCHPPLKYAAVGSTSSPSSQIVVPDGAVWQTGSASVRPARPNEPPPSIAMPPPSCEPNTMMTAVGLTVIPSMYSRRFPPMLLVTVGESGPSLDQVDFAAPLTPKVM